MSDNAQHAPGSGTLSAAPLSALQDAVEAAYRGSVYGFERTADGFVLTVVPSELAGGAPLTSGTYRRFRFIVVVDPATATYRVKVRTFGTTWQLPGVNEGAVRLVQTPNHVKISANLRGTTLTGGVGEQRFEYDSDTDARRIAAIAALLGWTRTLSSVRIGPLLGIIFGGVAVVLAIVFGILFATGVF